MRPHVICLIGLFIFLSLACAPKKTIRVPVDPGDELFSKAEKLFEEKSFDEAIAAYQEYVSRFPDRPFAAAGLLKIAKMYAVLDKDDQARQTYERLMATYPDSPIIPEATVQMLSFMYERKAYAETIQRGSQALEKVSSKAHVARIYALMGDAYMAREAPMDAVDAYASAYAHAEDPSRAAFLLKLKHAVNALDVASISQLLRKKPETIQTGYLLYRLAVKHIEAEKYQDAEKALSEMIDRFPAHEHAEVARELLDELYRNFIYRPDTLGCLLPLSGPYKSYGHRALKGIELALSRYIAENPGMNGSIIVRDTASDPDIAAAAVGELIEARVAALIGPLIFPESAAAEAQKKGIPIITLTQKDQVTGIGDYVFRNFITPKMQMKAIASYASDTLGLTRFAILYPNENYGTTFMNLFWDEVIARGGTVVGVEAYDANQTDFAAAIKKLVGLYYDIPEDLKAVQTPVFEGGPPPDLFEAGEPTADEPVVEAKEPEAIVDEAEEPEAIVDFDAVFIPDSPKKAGLIIPQLAFYDIENVSLFGTNLWHSERLIQMARQYVQGAVMADSFYVDSASQPVRYFVEIYRKTYGETPGFIEAIAYDTTLMLLQVVRQPGIQTRKAIRDALISFGTYNGVTGFSTFDDDGDIRKKLYLLRIEGDQFVEIHKDRVDPSETESKPSGVSQPVESGIDS